MTRPDPHPTADEIATGLAPLLADDQVVELRAVKVPDGRRTATVSGYFDPAHRRHLAEAAARLARTAGAVYVTLNPLLPAALARRANRADRAGDVPSAGVDVVARRRWLDVDVDPARPSGVSATDAEKAAGAAVADAVRAFLAGRGWPDPLAFDSGNGTHLLYRIDRPADDDAIRRCLVALADRFDAAGGTVDRGVYPANLLVKVPGTWSRKGDSVPDRPHRRCRWAAVPHAAAVVPDALIDALAAEADRPADSGTPTGRGGPPGGGRGGHRLDVSRWLTDRRVPFTVAPRPTGDGRTVYRLAACPFDPAHAAGDAAVFQAADGALSAHCFHNSCAGKGWQAFKAALGPPDPDHFDPPLRPRPAGRAASPPGPAAAAAEGTEPAGRPVLRIDAAAHPLDDTLRRVAGVLAAGGDAYRRAGQVAHAEADRLAPVLDPTHLAAVLSRHTEVVVAADRRDEFRPLPPAYAATWLRRPDLWDALPEVTLVARHPVVTPDGRITRPGFDRPSGVYTFGPAVRPLDGTARLDRLLAGFCFQTPADRTHLVAALVTAVLMPRFVGRKPALLVTANQPGLGKSLLAQAVAVVRDGGPVPTATFTPNEEEFEKRLGAMVRAGLTTLVVDNARPAGGRALESAVLERTITDPVVSFRLLGASDQIRAENSLQVAITANAPRVGRDLVSRCLPVRLAFDGDPRRRTFALADPLAFAREHRAALLGEVLGLVVRWQAAGGPRVDTRTRFDAGGWGPTVGGVLAAGGFPDFLATVDEAAAAADPVHGGFAVLLAALADLPARSWTPAELADEARRRGLLADELAGSDHARAVRFGLLAGRFVGEPFPLPAGGWVVLERVADRKGTTFRLRRTPAPG